MNLFTAAFSKIFKSGNQQVLDKIKPLIVEINNREKSLSPLKNEEFKEKTQCLVFLKNCSYPFMSFASMSRPSSSRSMTVDTSPLNTKDKIM